LNRGCKYFCIFAINQLIICGLTRSPKNILLKLFNLKSNKIQNIISEYQDEMVWVTDEEGNIIRASKSSFSILGYAPKKLRGKNFYDFIPEDDYPTLKDLLEKSLSNGKARQKVWFYSQSQNLVMFKVKTSYLKDQSILVHNIQKHGYPGSDLKYFEIKHNTYRFLLKNMTDALIVLNYQGILVYAQGLKEMLGYNENEVIGGTAFAPVHPEDKENTLQVFQEYLQKGEFEHNRLDYRLMNTRGEYVWVEGNFKVIEELETGEKMILNNIRDISERKRMEKEIKDSNQTKDKLLSLIAHDLKSPLSNISGFAYLLKENFETDPKDKTHTNIDFIYESSRQVNELVDNLLNWARLQTNRISVNKEAIDLKQTVEKILSYYQETKEKKSLSIELQIQDNLNVFADPNMTRAIFRNIISNAFKYSYPQGIITIGTLKTNNSMVCIYVKDQGVGLSEEQVRSIHNNRDFASTRGTGKEEGSGLGLNITREFVHKNAGQIKFESNEHNGTTVKVCLPEIS